MRGSFYLLFVGLFLFSCSNATLVEDQLYDELKSEYKKKGIDLEALLDDIENELIANGTLSGKGGLAKLKYYQKVAAGDLLKSPEDQKILETLKKLPFDNELLVKCQKEVQKKGSGHYIRSAYYLKVQKIQVKLVSLGTVTPATVAKAILSQYGAEEFDKPYYRAFMLLSVAMTMDIDTAYLRKIPKQEDLPEVEDAPEKLVTIELNSIGQIAIDGKVYPENKVEEAYTLAHDLLGPGTTIRLEVSKQASYESYMTIQSMIEKYAYEARHKEALRSFHNDYPSLSEAQKSQVDAAHPVKVIEVTLD